MRRWEVGLGWGQVYGERDQKGRAAGGGAEEGKEEVVQNWWWKM